MKKLFRLPVFVLAFFAASTQLAHAEGYALYEFSARGVALGGATMARKPDPSAIATNPALIARLEGKRFLGGLSVISPSGQMDGNVGGQPFSAALKEAHWVVPHAYYTQSFGEKFTFGIGEFSRFGLGFEYPHNWAGRENIYEVALTTASIAPVIAVKATDQLSMAFGMEVMYATLDMRKHVVLGAIEVDSNIQDADDYGVGFNFSGHYQFNEEWAAGLVFRSPVKLKCEGTVDFTTLSGPSLPIFQDGKASGEVTLPLSLGGGVSWSPMSDLSVEVGAIWTEWSSFDSLDITTPAGLNENPKDWRNAWRFNVGVEYDLTDWLAIRAGYVFDQSPMTEGYEDYLVPTDDRHIYSVGLGFTHNDWNLDLAYAYIDPVGRKYNANSATHVLDSEAKASKTDIFSVSVGYKF